MRIYQLTCQDCGRGITAKAPHARWCPDCKAKPERKRAARQAIAANAIAKARALGTRQERQRLFGSTWKSKAEYFAHVLRTTGKFDAREQDELTGFKHGTWKRVAQEMRAQHGGTLPFVAALMSERLVERYKRRGWKLKKNLAGVWLLAEDLIAWADHKEAAERGQRIIQGVQRFVAYHEDWTQRLRQEADLEQLLATLKPAFEAIVRVNPSLHAVNQARNVVVLLRPELKDDELFVMALAERLVA